MDEDANGRAGAGRDGRAAAGRTNVGRIREHNEDAFLVRAPLFVVADGMGGHQAGEVASAHAIAELGGAFDAGRITSGADLVRALCDAHEVIATDARRSPSRRGMGTTCVAVLVVGRVAHVAHIGDSRAYLLRAGRLERLTEDHSLVAVLIRDGVLREADAERDPRRHIVLRALGAEEPPRPDLRDIPLRSDDRLLLCSDGLSGVVPEDEIATLLAIGSPDEAAERLVSRTLSLGAPDNVTVVVVDAGPAGEAGLAGEEGRQRRRAARAGRRRRTLGAIGGGLAVALAGVLAVSTVGSQSAPAALLGQPGRSPGAGSPGAASPDVVASPAGSAQAASPAAAGSTPPSTASPSPPSPSPPNQPTPPATAPTGDRPAGLSPSGSPTPTPGPSSTSPPRP